MECKGKTTKVLAVACQDLQAGVGKQQLQHIHTEKKKMVGGRKG